MIKLNKITDLDILRSLSLMPRSVEVLMFVNFLNFIFPLVNKFRFLIQGRRN